MADRYGYEGFHDDKTSLDAEDDIASVTLGGKWRIPTKEEWEELLDPENCEWPLDSGNKGMEGYTVRSKIAGYTDKSIYLPKNGFRSFSDVNGDADSPHGAALYWSSSLNVESPSEAYALYLIGFKTIHEILCEYRYYGNGIRPVTE